MRSEFANYDPAANVGGPLCLEIFVTFVATMSGEVAIFDYDAFAASIAAYVGLAGPEWVNVTAAAGSVVATATFTRATAEDAAIAAGLLNFTSPASATLALSGLSGREFFATQVSFTPPRHLLNSRAPPST